MFRFGKDRPLLVREERGGFYIGTQGGDAPRRKALITNRCQGTTNTKAAHLQAGSFGGIVVVQEVLLDARLCLVADAILRVLWQVDVDPRRLQGTYTEHTQQPSWVMSDATIDQASQRGAVGGMHASPIITRKSPSGGIHRRSRTGTCRST